MVIRCSALAELTTTDSDSGASIPETIEEFVEPIPMGRHLDGRGMYPSGARGICGGDGVWYIVRYCWTAYKWRGGMGSRYGLRKPVSWVVVKVAI
jgi:hypothetical protein